MLLSLSTTPLKLISLYLDLCAKFDPHATLQYAFPLTSSPEGSELRKQNALGFKKNPNDVGVKAVQLHNSGFLTTGRKEQGGAREEKPLM